MLFFLFIGSCEECSTLLPMEPLDVPLDVPVERSAHPARLEAGPRQVAPRSTCAGSRIPPASSLLGYETTSSCLFHQAR